MKVSDFFIQFLLSFGQRGWYFHFNFDKVVTLDVCIRFVKSFIGQFQFFVGLGSWRNVQVCLSAVYRFYLSCCAQDHINNRNLDFAKGILPCSFEGRVIADSDSNKQVSSIISFIWDSYCCIIFNSSRDVDTLLDCGR